MRARDYEPGEQVPGTVYKILRLIGAGGMGTVYDVEDTTIGKRYVLKTLHPRLGAREDLARRIQNEARTLARLHHPNIVEVITAGVTGDALKLPYYLMERLSGQSLRVILEKKGRLDLSHAYHIGIDLLDALDHAHDKGVIHRDVKPDNIFLHRTSAGVTLTKLLDFGIVSMLDASGGETAGRFLGTLRYAAPEQLRGEKPTVKTDVYSAGLVLYEIIAGRGPFDDEGDAHRVAAAHMNKFPIPVSEFTDVPRELDVLLMAALAKNPEARPRDAFSFAASLRNLKRVAEDLRHRAVNESRNATAAAIVFESTPSLSELRIDSNSGNSPSPSLPALAKTTAVGLADALHPPTLASVTVVDLRNRGATTGTLGPDTLPDARDGTEAVAPPLPSLVAAQLGEAATELQWPMDRAPILSDEPQVRSLLPSLPSTPRPRRVGRSLALVLGALPLAAIAVFTIRHAAARRVAASDSARPKIVVVAPASSPPMAAPAVAPPEPLASAAVSVAIAVPPGSAASAQLPPVESTLETRRKPEPAAKPHPARPALPTAPAKDRPTAGF